MTKPTPEEAKQILKARGWSYRRAAPALGVHYMHLYAVLSGQRESRSLLNRIASLPKTTPPYKTKAAKAA